MSKLITKGHDSGTGAITLESPNTNIDRTISLPDATGTVMVTGNMPAFSAYQTITQSISNSTATKVTFDVEEYDTNNNFSSSRFTPTVAGYYQVNSNVGWGFTTGLALVDIYKNGSLYKYGSFSTGTAIGCSASCSALVYMNGTTDYLEIFTFQLTGLSNNTTAASYATYFQASMVRSA